MLTILSTPRWGTEPGAYGGEELPLGYLELDLNRSIRSLPGGVAEPLVELIEAMDSSVDSRGTVFTVYQGEGSKRS